MSSFGALEHAGIWDYQQFRSSCRRELALAMTGLVDVTLSFPVEDLAGFGSWSLGYEIIGEMHIQFRGTVDACHGDNV
jgi:hypothetical protein